MNGGGAEREGDTESEAGSRLWAISPEPDAGLELTDREMVTWAEVGRLTDWATQAPQFLIAWGSSILFSAVVVPIYISNNSVQRFPFLHILSSTC